VIELGRRAVACKGWRWLPGSLAIFEVGCVSRRLRSDQSELPAGDVPDLSDPATLGCLLALVREAWGDPELCVVSGGPGNSWGVVVNDDPLLAAATEAEALVAALEAAP